MKKNYLTVLFIFLPVLLMAQESFTAAYRQYRPYHYQTPQAWNRIRREVASPGKVIWSLMERDTRFMYLTGTWKELVPAPTKDNTYFFKGEEDIGRMYNLIIQPDAFGYIVYPYWMEQKIKFSEDDNVNRNIILRGFMNTIVSDIPDDIEEFLELVVYNTDSINEKTLEPVMYGDEKVIQWQLSPNNQNLCNIKNFYCYFDNRPDSLQRKVRYTTEVTKDFNMEVNDLSSALDAADLSYVMIPYWMTDVYLSLPEHQSRQIHRYGYPGYIINPISGGVELNNNWSSLNMMDFGPYSAIRYDLVAFCGDSLSTDYFLGNRDAWELFIYNIFDPEKGMINRKDSAFHQPSGLNIYFPEFNFRKKRAMKQFVKSLSLVIDSLTIDSKKKYSKLDLSLTFSRQAAVRESDYLSGLTCFVDTIYFADFDANGLTDKLRFSDGTIDTSSVWAKIINPFYLFRIPYKTIQPGINDGDLMSVAHSDYSSGRWGIYFIITILSVIALLALLIFRYFSPLINRYMESHHTAMVLLMITLVMEIFVFFFFTIEALSPQRIIFDMAKDDSLHLLLIALPLIPIALYLAFINLRRDNILP